MFEVVELSCLCEYCSVIFHNHFLINLSLILNTDTIFKFYCLYVGQWFFVVTHLLYLLEAFLKLAVAAGVFDFFYLSYYTAYSRIYRNF